MNFKLGDEVSYTNDTGGGKVIEVISAYKLRIEDEHGFDYIVNVSDLVLNQGLNYESNDKDLTSILKENADIKSEEIKQREFAKKSKHLISMDRDVVEIDLHIENLLDAHEHLSNAQILSVQMSHYQRALNSAIARKANKLVVIHGVGEGVLRSEIRRDLVEHHPEMDHHDASYRLYGYGATEIILR